MENQKNHIDSFESAVYQRDYTLSLRLMIILLEKINTSGFNFRNLDYFGSSLKAEINATRIASALLSMLSDKKFKMDWEKYKILINHKSTLTSVLRVSGFSGSQTMTSYFLNEYLGSKNRKHNTSQLYKLLIVMGLSDLNDNSLKLLTEIDPKIATPFILSLLSSHAVLRESEHISREKLLAFGPIIEQKPIDFDFTGILAVAWMHTSYGIRSDKHLFKGHLNHLMRRTLDAAGYSIPRVKAIDLSIPKPRVIVLAEVFMANHAMGRCYSNYIKQLKREFEVILVASDDSVDEAALSLFDDAKIFSTKSKSIHQIAELIDALQGDIIYYPSIGMATWTVALVSYRFAPIQIAATGHPATTISDAIDYLIAPEFLFYNLELFSERLLCLSNDLESTHKKRIDESFPNAVINYSPDVVRIAVNAKSFKINPVFLAACQSINQKLDKPVEWIFFTHEVDLLNAHCRLDISQWLPNSQTIDGTNYNDYLAMLNQCDIAVSPFPFGGSNSNIDLLRLGIPLIFLTGEEIHSRTDEFYFRYFDLCDGLACHSIDDFYGSVTRMVEDDSYRVSLSNKILNLDTDTLLMPEKYYDKTDVVDTFLWVWKNHQVILDEDLKIIRPEDRLIDLDSGKDEIHKLVEF